MFEKHDAAASSSAVCGCSNEQTVGTTVDHARALRLAPADPDRGGTPRACVVLLCGFLVPGFLEIKKTPCGFGLSHGTRVVSRWAKPGIRVVSPLSHPCLTPVSPLSHPFLTPVGGVVSGAAPPSDQVIICDEELVVLDERVDLPGVEESEDHPAVEASVELHYTVIVKTHRLSVGSPGKAIGTAVTGVEVGTTASGTSVAVLKRQMNGAVLVIEAGACLADHYLIQPSETAAAAARGASGGPDADGHADPNADTHTEPPHSTAITSGVIIGFCRLSEAYAAYKTDADGSSYWLPITLFTDSDATTTTATDDNEKQFGQIGGEFYVRLANGKREHVQTALRKCQTWVDHASHNRSERFRVKRRQQNGELSPLGYYALIEGTGEHANLLFRIRTLDKLVKKTDGYSAWLPSASFDTPDVQVQWAEYEQRDDGIYIRTARQSDQQPLDNMPMAIAMKVTLVEADGVSGGTLSEDSSASLLKLSLIDERSARSVREVAVLAPPKLRNNTQPVPFDFDTSRTVTSISDSSRFPGENHPS